MHKYFPIKSIERIQAYKSYFKKQQMRDYLLFVITLNIPYKIKDILCLTPKQLHEEKHHFIFNVNNYHIHLNEEDSALLKSYIADLQPTSYIFKSTKTNAPLTRQQFNRILARASTALQSEHTLCPTALKKTFAYHAYMNGVHITDIQKILGHQSKHETYQFIDETPQTYYNIQLNL